MLETVHCLDGVPGNAAAYVRLHDGIPSLVHWTSADWCTAYVAYYAYVKDPGTAWLHDIYKNRCEYDIDRTYDFILRLKLSLFPFD